MGCSVGGMDMVVKARDAYHVVANLAARLHRVATVFSCHLRQHAQAVLHPRSVRPPWPRAGRKIMRSLCRALNPPIGGVDGAGPVRVQTGACPSSASARLSNETHSWPSAPTRTRIKGTQRLPHSSSSSAKHIPCFSHITPPLSHSHIARVATRTTATTTTTTILTTTTPPNSTFTM